MYINTKENNEHYKGKVWITKGYRNKIGNNICLDTGKDKLMVIAFVPTITEEKIINAIKAMGYNPEEWLKED